MMKKLYMNGFCALTIAGSALSQSAFAALHDRGGGLLYDDVLNVTWLQDANYAKTSGYDSDGRMNWAAANTWAAGLVYGGYDDWRLARNSPVASVWNDAYSSNGSTDTGYNITSPNSELAYMYYVNLGLKGYFSLSGVYQPDFGVFGNGTWDGEANVGLVINLQPRQYWSGTPYAPNPGSFAWVFNSGFGVQDYGYHVLHSEFSAWAVRSGDVAAPIPEPETYAMLLAGLGLLGGVARRRRHSPTTGQ